MFADQIRQSAWVGQSKTKTRQTSSYANTPHAVTRTSPTPAWSHKQVGAARKVRGESGTQKGAAKTVSFWYKKHSKDLVLWIGWIPHFFPNDGAIIPDNGEDVLSVGLRTANP